MRMRECDGEILTSFIEFCSVVDSMVASPVRRSTRRRHKTANPFRWRNLSETSRKIYSDLGHGRLARCTRRLLDSSDDERQELRKMGLSFVAMAISSAASAGGGSSREGELISYVNAAIECDLNVDDVFNSDSAISLAAYHGFSHVLGTLLDGGHALMNKDSSTGRSAVFAAVRNGQHRCLEIISQRTKEARLMVEEEKFGYEQRGFHFSCLLEAVTKGDVASAQMLLSAGAAIMSDIDCKIIYAKQKNRSRFQMVLQSMYPCIANVMHWRGELHWSFPTADRETINWLWHALHRPHSPELLPDEMWMRVLNFVGRGWFASRRYQLIGAPDSEILQRNVI